MDDKNDGDRQPIQPGRRDFLATAAATLGALGLPAVAGGASAAAPIGRGKGQRPNFLFLMVDEMRYPPVYESADLQAFRATYLKTQNALRANGVEFNRHYAASTACVPGRWGITSARRVTRRSGRASGTRPMPTC